MRNETGTTILRQDYQPYPFSIPTVRLTFELDANQTWVSCTLEVKRKTDAQDMAAANADLILNGEDLTLISIHVNGLELSSKNYVLNETTLTLLNLPDEAEITIVSTCRPVKNTSLSGLYVSGNSLFTQCEAQGFRRICWFADRPDVMSEYWVTLRGDRKLYPTMLSNGNLIHQQDLSDGIHESQWHDPFAKPCYLFAVVAGNFACREHITKTASGRDVLLQIYSDQGTVNHTAWAMESLEKSLRWDEERFGLELDLDRFMIVAARDFNMGAMENKGLNIFNAAYVLADPNTATDANYQAIEAVIGHEYFHNWTGNRVTCRDWFQLSLKEGLTVFRDQEFTADMMAHGLPTKEAASARAIKRIDDVVALRSAQFPEDSGPMAHPIRPESYQEIGNFYTATVYEKGAEVIRMMHTLLGEKGFRAGMDEYFRRHDGQAVTCDDFVSAMQWAYERQHPGNPEINLEIFKHWYSQAGTPRVRVEMSYDAQAQLCHLTLSQHCDRVGVEKQSGLIKEPFHIPVLFGLLDSTGKSLPLKHNGQTVSSVLLELLKQKQTWTFSHIESMPTPSLLRDFSAPVIIEYDYNDTDLALLSAHDSNAFARWEAGQELASRQIIRLAEEWRNTGHCGKVDDVAIQSWKAILLDASLDAGYRARALALPTEKILVERMSLMDPLAIAHARQSVRKQLGQACLAELLDAYEQNATPGAYSPAAGPSGKRALKNLALSYLLAAEHTKALELTLTQFNHATNMTDRMAGLTGLTLQAHSETASEAIMRFYEDWQHEPLVIDKWFAAQANSALTNVDRIRGLMAHPAFTLRNPNRARALIFQFCMANPIGFYAEDGSGYAFWAEQVLALDEINPEIAARLARAMDQWSRMIPSAGKLMQAQLQKVAAHPDLSRNTLEIVSKALSL